MFSILKPFVPSRVCLACDGCCRFSDPQSCWRPKVAEGEQFLAASSQGKKDASSSDVIDPGRAVKTISWKGQHICYFLNPRYNTCGIYPSRPFECQLYPFLLVKKTRGFELGVHLACPYVQDQRHTEAFKKYLEELISFFAQKASTRFLLGYRAVSQDYAGYEKEIEILFTVE